MSGQLLRTVEAQAAEVALGLSDGVGGRIDREDDGMGEGVDEVDVDGRLGDGLDVEGHGRDLSLLDSLLEGHLCLARRERKNLVRGVAGTG